MRHPLLLVGRDLALPFIRWAQHTRVGISWYNADWFAVYGHEDYDLALGWLALMGKTTFVYSV